MNILIKNNQTGIVQEYGASVHDSLHISYDGSYLYYENLQNGHDSLSGSYSFVMEDGKTPKESKVTDVMCLFNIGDFRTEEVERPQGEWNILQKDDNGIHEIECPFCKYSKGGRFASVGVTFHKLPPFCESCGADMRGAE